MDEEKKRPGPPTGKRGADRAKWIRYGTYIHRDQLAALRRYAHGRDEKIYEALDGLLLALPREE